MKEKERERKCGVRVCVCMYVYMYVCKREEIDIFQRDECYCCWQGVNLHKRAGEATEYKHIHTHRSHEMITSRWKKIYEFVLYSY